MTIRRNCLSRELRQFIYPNLRNSLYLTYDAIFEVGNPTPKYAPLVKPGPAAMCSHNGRLYYAVEGEVRHVITAPVVSDERHITALCSHKGQLYHAAGNEVKPAGTPAIAGWHHNSTTALCSDGKLLYSGGKDGRILNVASGIHIIDLDEQITGLCAV